MSDDSYAWKSSVQEDPYYSQRRLSNKKSYNQRLSAELAQIRKSVRPEGGPSIPDAWRQKLYGVSEAEGTTDSATASRRRLTQARALYM